MSKEGYIPEWAKKGTLIDPANPQPLIRQNAEKNRAWEFQPVADKWYPIAEEIKKTLFDGVFTLERTSPLPSPPIAVEDMRNYRTLASYRIVPDGYGINDKLTLNAQHFVNKEGIWVWDWGGDWGLAETITHELAHEKHKHWGNTPPDHGKYFRKLLLDLGIYCTPNGSHYRPAEEGKPFAILMHRIGIQRPENEKVLPEKSKVSYWEPKDERKKRGRSTLHKWICPDCGLAARIGVGKDPKLVHDVCSEAKGEKVFLVKHNGLSHTIYRKK